MRPGHGDAVAKAHQFSQHFRAPHHRNTLRVGGHHFGIVGSYRGGGHHHIGATDPGGAVTKTDLHTQVGEPASQRGFFHVRAADLITEVVQHFGDPPHTHTTNTDEMDTTNAPHARQCAAALHDLQGRVDLSHEPPPCTDPPPPGSHRAWRGRAPPAPWPTSAHDRQAPKSSLAIARRSVRVVE